MLLCGIADAHKHYNAARGGVVAAKQGIAKGSYNSAGCYRAVLHGRSIAASKADVVKRHDYCYCWLLLLGDNGGGFSWPPWCLVVRPPCVVRRRGAAAELGRENFQVKWFELE
ncbi:hypothetical protein SLA2020_451230 [Shorea laevis]